MPVLALFTKSLHQNPVNPVNPVKKFQSIRLRLLGSIVTCLDQRPLASISVHQCHQVRQAKSDIPHKMKGVYHVNVVPNMKPTGGERSNPQAEARDSKHMSRNIRELDSASLHQLRVTKLPDMLKSAIVGEEVLKSNRRTLRGDWRRRVWKGMSRNLRDPSCHAVGRESEGPIVAEKGLIRLERRGPAVNTQPRKQYATA